MEIEDPMFTQR